MNLWTFTKSNTHKQNNREKQKLLTTQDLFETSTALFQPQYTNSSAHLFFSGDSVIGRLRWGRVLPRVKRRRKEHKDTPGLNCTAEAENNDRPIQNVFKVQRGQSLQLNSPYIRLQVRVLTYFTYKSFAKRLQAVTGYGRLPGGNPISKSLLLFLRWLLHNFCSAMFSELNKSTFTYLFRLGERRFAPVTADAGRYSCLSVLNGGWLVSSPTDNGA